MLLTLTICTICCNQLHQILKSLKTVQKVCECLLSNVTFVNFGLPVFYFNVWLEFQQILFFISNNIQFLIPLQNLWLPVPFKLVLRLMLLPCCLWPYYLYFEFRLLFNNSFFNNIHFHLAMKLKSFFTKSKKIETEFVMTRDGNKIQFVKHLNSRIYFEAIYISFHRSIKICQIKPFSFHSCLNFGSIWRFRAKSLKSRRSFFRSSWKRMTNSQISWHVRNCLK